MAKMYIGGTRSQDAKNMQKLEPMSPGIKSAMKATTRKKNGGMYTSTKGNVTPNNQKGK